MSVDQIDRSLPQFLPQRDRIVEEQIRLVPDSSGYDDEVVIAGFAEDLLAAFVPVSGADEREIDAPSAQRPVAGTPRVDDTRLIYAQNAQRVRPVGARNRLRRPWTVDTRLLL